MKTKTKIVILVVVLVLGGMTVYKWQKKRNEPTIKIVKSDRSTKEVQFKMSYKDMNFETSIKLGGIRRQAMNNYIFEAISQGQTIVLSIKDNAGNILKKKVIDFANA